MTRAQWLCSISAATGLFLISGLSSASATALEFRAGKALLLSIIGKSALVRTEIESVLGASSSAAKWLLGKSATEIGQFAVHDDPVAANIASRLSTANKLQNSLRLPESSENLFLSENKNLFPYRSARLEKESAEFDSIAKGLKGPDRTISIVGFGNLEVNPSFKVPLGRFGSTHWQYELKSLPVGTVLGVGGTGGTAAAVAGKALGAVGVKTCGQECVDSLKKPTDFLNAAKGSDIAN